MHHSPIKRWYALHVRSRREKVVHVQLQAKQHRSFLPLYSVENKWADRWQTVDLPLFPGYVFCHFDIGARTSVLTTTGLIDIVRAGSEPAAIDDTEIEAIQTVLQAKVPVEPHPNLVVGQSVVITGGPLTGLVGTLANIRSRVRFVINVEMLGRAVLVEIDRDWIAPSNQNGRRSASVLLGSNQN